MENKYSDLEKLKQLKDNGTITDAEYEIQKHKILNTTTETKGKKNKSKVFFIISSIGIVISIILAVISYLWHDSDMYIDTLLNNKSLNSAISNIVDGSFTILIITTITMLIVGIVFKIKERGESKNVKEHN